MNTIHIKTEHLSQKFKENKLKEWFESFDTIITDCDGTIWKHNDAIPGAVEVLNKLKANGKQVYYITNNGLQTPDEILEKAQKMGFHVTDDELITPLKGIVDYLKQHNFKQRVYVVGNPAITSELNKYGIRSYGTGSDTLDVPLMKFIVEKMANENKQNKEDVVGAVIVGWDEHFCYAKMMKATSILVDNQQSHFLATNLDAVHKSPNVHIPGTGAFVRSIECSAGRKAKEMGKPNPEVLEPLISTGKIKPARTLMVGDCLRVDVNFAQNCGMQSLLVGTGSYTWDYINKEMPIQEGSTIFPDYYVDSIGDLLEYVN